MQSGRRAESPVSGYGKTDRRNVTPHLPSPSNTKGRRTGAEGSSAIERPTPPSARSTFIVGQAGPTDLGSHSPVRSIPGDRSVISAHGQTLKLYRPRNGG